MLVRALGLSHWSAPVEVRERVAGRIPELEARIAKWRDGPHPIEAVLVSTCNRLELFVASPAGSSPEDPELVEAAAEALGVAGEAAGLLYLHRGREASRHLFRVASSLDSQVLGEDQILGQVRDAFQKAAAEGSTGPVLNHLFHRALRIGKRVRTETGIARSPVSVASAGIRLVRRVFGELDGLAAALVGVGEMTHLAMVHLREHGVRRFLVVNRTLERAVAMAEEVGGEAFGLPELGSVLARVDLVVAATGATSPVVARDLVAEARRERAAHPLLFLDLGIPRDVDPGVHDLDNVFLYDLDDLEAITAESREARREAAQQGEALVAAEAEAFETWLASRPLAPLIEDLKSRVHSLARCELDRALRKVSGLDPAVRAACERAVEAVADKLLHHPVVALRGLGPGEERDRTVSVVRDLFRLGTDRTGADREEEEETTEDPGLPSVSGVARP